MAIDTRYGGRTMTLPPESLAGVGEQEVLESEAVSSADSVTDIFGELSDTLAHTVTTHPDAAMDAPTALSGRRRESGELDRCGEIIQDRYRLLRRLGKGGMGTVYLAEHTSIPKTFAVKLLNRRYASREDVAARFLQEARAVSLVDHENVVGVVDFGTAEDGSAYLVMEHLRGEPLKVLCKTQAPLPWSRVRHIMGQLCDALSAAHELGIVHRDIKPDNVLRTTRGQDVDCVKVLDFGLAKIQASGGLRLTRTGMVLGTPEYMAPEQARGAPIDHRVDIYAAGILYYELLCGRTPFKAKSFIAMRNQHLLVPPAPPSEHAPDAGITEAMDAIALKALAKDPSHRFASIAAMGEAIAAVGTGAAPVALTEALPGPGLLSPTSMLSVGGRLSQGASARAQPRLEVGAGAGAAVDSGASSSGSGSMTWRNSSVATASSSTSAGSNTDSDARMGLILAAVLVALVAGLGGMAWATFGPGGPSGGDETAVKAGGGQAGPAANEASEANEALAPPRAEDPPPVVADTGEGAATAAVVTFEINVDEATVYEAVDQALVGRVSPDAPTLEFPRSDEPVRLLLRAPGYRELMFELTPDGDQALSFELVVDPKAKVEPEPTGSASGSKAGDSGKASSPSPSPSPSPSEPEPEAPSDSGAAPAEPAAAPDDDEVVRDNRFSPEIIDPWQG
ncbi:serine/threonine protein kinase [Plesiocystis pacifica SIR-1]|uniref:non-specific serine/threonine protein kinase n=1 Tax=Plesiocystis pacifica SIR-1 TaxID=391625 RepID=A6G0M2_9BACT|nr:serine/threonine-protein kinase [Plesiocystis pacifica]EDM80668.1 serine/threonine protein kinase [Plesiocystis pacifica SIR-1]